MTGLAAVIWDQEDEGLREYGKRHNLAELDERVIKTSPLCDLLVAGVSLEVFSEHLEESVVFVPDEESKGGLKAGETAYTINELEKIVWLNPSPQILKKLHLLKKEFEARLVPSSDDECRHLLDGFVKRIASTYETGSIEWAKANAPSLWGRIRELESKADEECLKPDPRGLVRVLYQLTDSWARVSAARQEAKLNLRSA